MGRKEVLDQLGAGGCLELERRGVDLTAELGVAEIGHQRHAADRAPAGKHLSQVIGGIDDPPQHECLLVDPQNVGPVGPPDSDAVAVAALDGFRRFQAGFLHPIQEFFDGGGTDQQVQLRRGAGVAPADQCGGQDPVAVDRRHGQFGRCLLLQHLVGEVQDGRVELLAVADDPRLVDLHAELVGTLQGG